MAAALLRQAWDLADQLRGSLRRQQHPDARAYAPVERCFATPQLIAPFVVATMVFPAESRSEAL